MTRPGSTLRAFAARLLPPSALERLIDPAIADLQCEHADALRQGRRWRSRWIRLAGYSAFWKVTVIAATRHALRERTTADDRAVGRTVVFSLVAMMVLTAVLLWPALRTFRLRDTGTKSWLVLYLVPSAVAFALPLGLVFGIFLGLRDRASTTRVKWNIAALGILCSAAAFIIVGWLMPAANQAFRELAAGSRLLLGFNELSLGQLASGDPTRLMRVMWGGVTTKRLAWEFHSRVALAFAPLALALFALGATAARRREYGRVTMGVAALTAAFGYYVLLFYARESVLYSDWLPSEVAAWLPNLVFLAMALLLFRRPAAAGTQESHR
jgi:lipopolysaccharide export LptBFGC system permease protein LptF